jgi:hypothetical protein
MAAAEIDDGDQPLLALETIVCASMRVGQLFPEWTSELLAGRVQVLDSAARLFVATNLKEAAWPSENDEQDLEASPMELFGGLESS